MMDNRFDRGIARSCINRAFRAILTGLIVSCCLTIGCSTGSEALDLLKGVDLGKYLYDYSGTGPGVHTLSCPKHRTALIRLAPGEAKTAFKFVDPGGDDTCYCSPGDTKRFVQDWVYELERAAGGTPSDQLSPRARRIRSNAGRYVKDVEANGVPMIGTRAFDGLQKFVTTGSLTPPPGGTDSISESCYTLGQLKTLARSLLPYLRLAADKAR